MQPLEPRDLRVFAPPWELQCVRQFLLSRTRHLCDIADCRLYADLESELTEAARVAEAQVAVVFASTERLGEAAAVLDILKRRVPDAITALAGPHASQFPEHAVAIPRADFIIAGDPEPILHNFLDNADIPQRLQKVPGLLFRDGPAREAYWLDNLRSLSLPEWDGVFWPAYRSRPDEPGRAVARLSRGHTRCPADRSFGRAYEPLRLWPMERLAAAIQKCGPFGISEVFLDDPPGVWSAANLRFWCSILSSVRNVQPWSLRMLPTHLQDDTILLLYQSLCRRIEFLFPSADPEILRSHGCVIEPRELSRTFGALEKAGITVHCRFWLGYPGAEVQNEVAVPRTIRQLGYRPFAVEALPFRLDAPLCEDIGEPAAAVLNEWLRWVVEPWTHDRPLTMWGDADAAARVDKAIRQIDRKIRHNPARIVRAAFDALRSTSWIHYLETKALGYLPAPTGTDKR